MTVNDVKNSGLLIRMVSTLSSKQSLLTSEFISCNNCIQLFARDWPTRAASKKKLRANAKPLFTIKVYWTLCDNKFSLGAYILLGDDTTVDNGEASDSGQYDALKNFGTQRCNIHQADLCTFQQRLAVFAPQPIANFGSELIGHYSGVNYTRTWADGHIFCSFPIILATLLVMTSQR